MSWKASAIEDLSGKTVVITGANSGLGLASSHALAAKGAHVIMTARDEQRGWAAKAKVEHAIPGASVEVRRLDTSSLDSVRSFTKDFSGPLDILLNNAGIMAIPFSQSVDGYEMHLATNHLGHFALTALLLESLKAAPAARVVTISSVAGKQTAMSFDDITTETGYEKWSAYARSKLANLLFTAELDRKLRDVGSTISALAAHPGLSDTNLFPDDSGRMGGIVKRLAQSADAGALPQLFAATSPTAQSGQYYGPSFAEFRGGPKLLKMPTVAVSVEEAQKLWAQSVDVTGLDFSF
ncbi:MAG: oxidoreductase [Actinobacteria bacterium]|nr:oxidoreductase [Actinomycetota bacterium]